MTLYRRAAWAAGILVVLCVASLLADYVIAAQRAPQDDKRIKSLQEQVKSDASLAPNLAAEQKRITGAHLARKFRDRWLAWSLIAASAAFLASAKRLAPRGAGFQPARVASLPRSSPAPRSTPTLAPGLDLSFVDTAVALHGSGIESAIPLLQAIQTHYRYLPDEALRRLCELTEITPAQVAGTSSFYGQFRRSPVGKHLVRVCHGTACHVSGARQITEELRRYLAIPDAADTDPSRTFTIDEVACLGCCSLAPVLMVDGHTAGRLTPAAAREALKPFDQEPA
ncbi:MAG: NAD(P)H-dependent oxidoreductase subunit E [Acidobacteriia bacterium]|nr:NAD(P)H-dependent oxidoreductase subunit E [Terriglobia bacterium]